MRVLYIFLLSVFIGSVFGRTVTNSSKESESSEESKESSEIKTNNELNGSNKITESNDSNNTLNLLSTPLTTPFSIPFLNWTLFNEERSSNKESTIDDTGDSLTTECNNNRGSDPEEEKNPNRLNDINNIGGRMFSDMSNMLRKIGRV